MSTVTNAATSPTPPSIEEMEIGRKRSPPPSAKILGEPPLPRPSSSKIPRLPPLPTPPVSSLGTIRARDLDWSSEVANITGFSQRRKLRLIGSGGDPSELKPSSQPNTPEAATEAVRERVLPGSGQSKGGAAAGSAAASLNPVQAGTSGHRRLWELLEKAERVR